MVSKSELLIYGIFLLTFLVIIAAIDNFLETQKDDTTFVSNCENFNGKDFLLTGGSSKPSNLQEAAFEMERLRWLCNGGSKV